MLPSKIYHNPYPISHYAHRPREPCSERHTRGKFYHIPYALFPVCPYRAVVDYRSWSWLLSVHLDCQCCHSWVLVARYPSHKLVLLTWAGTPYTYSSLQNGSLLKDLFDNLLFLMGSKLVLQGSLWCTIKSALCAMTMRIYTLAISSLKLTNSGPHVLPHKYLSDFIHSLVSTPPDDELFKWGVVRQIQSSKPSQ